MKWRKKKEEGKGGRGRIKKRREEERREGDGGRDEGRKGGRDKKRAGGLELPNGAKEEGQLVYRLHTLVRCTHSLNRCGRENPFAVVRGGEGQGWTWHTGTERTGAKGSAGSSRCHWPILAEDK